MVGKFIRRIVCETKLTGREVEARTNDGHIRLGKLDNGEEKQE